MNRFWLEFGFACGHSQQFGRFRQIKINQFPAIIADSMIVTTGLPVIAAGAIAKLYFVYEAGLLQKSQRVIDCCVADRGQKLECVLENFICSWVIFSLTHHLQNCLALASQFLFRLNLFDRLNHEWI